MKPVRKSLVLGAAIAIVLLAGVARARAVQEWYHTVTVQGRVTMFLLDDQANVDGLLLDGGSQVRLGPRMAEAMIALAKVGDAVSVVGRGGRASSFGRVVHARELTINGQTLTTVDEPRHGPPPGPRGAQGPQRGNEPPRPPLEAGRGRVPPPLARPADAPPAPAADGDVAGPGAANPPALPADPPGPGAMRTGAPAPPPVRESRPVTVRGKVQAFLVGQRGDVTGLVLASGEQVRFAPRVGETLIAQSTEPHPDVVVEGDAVRGEHGTIVRPRQLSAGVRTLILP